MQDEINSDDTTAERWAMLMAAAQDGNQRAYAQVLAEVTPFARALIRRFHSDPNTTEDVVQDTLLTVHRVRHTYEPGRSVHAWVAAIARRRAIDALRSKKRQPTGTTTAQEHDIVDPRANHAEAFAHRVDIAAAMSALSPGQREAVRLLKVEELSLEEASQQSGHSIPALKSLVHRALKVLRERLGVDE